MDLIHFLFLSKIAFMIQCSSNFNDPLRILLRYAHISCLFLFEYLNVSSLMQMVHHGPCRWVCFPDYGLLIPQWIEGVYRYMATALCYCFQINWILRCLWGRPSASFTWKNGLWPDLSYGKSTCLQGIWILDSRSLCFSRRNY